MLHVAFLVYHSPNPAIILQSPLFTVRLVAYLPSLYLIDYQPEPRFLKDTLLLRQVVGTLSTWRSGSGC